MGKYSDLTPEIIELSKICCKNSLIDPSNYDKMLREDLETLTVKVFLQV